MSTTVTRKPAPRIAKPAARYRRGKAPKGYADAASESEEEEEAGEEGDVQVGEQELGSDDEVKEEDEDIPLNRDVTAQGKSMKIALKEVDISKEGKVIVGGRVESGRTELEESEEEDDEGDAEEAPVPKTEIEGESSEDESSSEEEEPPKPMFRPVFVPKRGRVTVLEREREDQHSEEALERQRLEEEERKKQSHDMVAETIRRELAEKEKQKETPDVDDTDGVDPAAEFESWRLRELGRIKRDKEEQVRRDEEREEVERRRALPEEQRMKEDLERAKQSRDEKSKGQQKFLQKYWHKGAFYQDDEIMKKHDYTVATESTVDVIFLPEVMQVRNFGKRSRTKYTHLVDQDTTVASGGFGGTNFQSKPGAKPGEPGSGCFNCGGPHLKRDCPVNTGPPGTGANANGSSFSRPWGQDKNKEEYGRNWRDRQDGDRERSPRHHYGDGDRSAAEKGKRHYRDEDRDDYDRKESTRRDRDYEGRRDDQYASRYSRRSRSRTPPRRYNDGRHEREPDRSRRHSRDHSLEDKDRGGKRIRTN